MPGGLGLSSLVYCARGEHYLPLSLFCLSREEEDIATMVTPEKPLRLGLSHRSDVNAVAPTPQALRLSLGPLSPEKLEEILSEANRLAAQLEQCSLQEPQGAGSVPRKVKPSPRRETFVLKDSPVRDLLPTVSSSSSLRSSPHSSNLTPRLGSSDRKGSARALRTSGKKPLSTKRVSLGACIGPRGSVSAGFVVGVRVGADYPGIAWISLHL